MVDAAGSAGFSGGLGTGASSRSEAHGDVHASSRPGGLGDAVHQMKSGVGTTPHACVKLRPALQMHKKVANQRNQNRTHQQKTSANNATTKTQTRKTEAVKNQEHKTATQNPKHHHQPENRMNPSRLNRSHLRFSAEEYARLVEDARVYGDSIPNLIKAIYFKKKLLQPAMSKDDADRVLAALNRIGNNINQIARQLNAGFREGFNPAVQEMAESLRAIKTFILGYRGNGQN